MGSFACQASRIALLAAAVWWLGGCEGERPADPVEVSTAPAPIERVPLPDADMDGVPDALDECARSPVGVAVATNGCVLDSDGDGIGDGADQCPDTATGNEVDSAGCRPRLTESRALTLAIEFATGSASIVGDTTVVLDEVVALLAKYPETTVVVEGHTDSQGTRATNQALSAARAAAVVSAMVQRGVAPERATASGYGESRPVRPNDTAEGRAANRRVVAIVVPG